MASARNLAWLKERVTMPSLIRSALERLRQELLRDRAGAYQAAPASYSAQPDGGESGGQRPASLRVRGKPDTRLVIGVGKPRVARVRDGSLVRAKEHQRLGHVSHLFVARGRH